MNLFDSHAHYNDERFKEDLDTIIKENYTKGIIKTTCAGYNLNSTKQAIEIANKYNYIYATAGISPNDLSEKTLEELKEIEKLAQNEKVVAIGEIGLDYYWNKENKEFQKEVFIKQIEIANKLNLPIVIHTRDAAVDTIDILKNIKPCNKKGIFHCCPLNVELIKEAVKLGYYISFSGVITFKNAKPENAIKEVPLDKLLIETDSPYLTPEPYRGKRNDPSKVEFVAKKIAEILDIDIEELEQIVMENTMRIFGI
ncbi:MAG: TatD family hydrolase [Clostridia bacterium]|nr:TatD family hydrolase [Clostridia bacterium]